MVKRTLSPNLQSLQKRGRIDPISHRHRLHEAFNLSVLDHELVGVWNRRDNFPFANYSLLFTLCRLLSLVRSLGCNGRNRLWRWYVRSGVGKCFGHGTFRCSRRVRIGRMIGT